MDKDSRNMIAEYGKSLFERRYCAGTAGNISVRLDDERILVTPTNSCLGRLDPATLSVMNMNGEQLEGDKVSKEVGIHLAIYHQRPDCRAVLHLHSPYLTALSCLEDVDPDDAIRPFTPYFFMKVGRLPIIPYFRPGSPLIAEAMASRLHTENACLMANHGAVSLGTSLSDAANWYEELEETARLVFILSGKPIRYLSDDALAELKSIRQKTHPYHKLSSSPFMQK